MAEQQNGPQRRVKRRTFKDIILLLLILLVLFFVSLYFLFPQKDLEKEPVLSDLVETTTPSIESLSISESQQRDESIGADKDTAVSETGVLDTDTDGTLSETDAADPDCQAKADTVNGFFEHLDNRDYIQAFALGEKSSTYFPALIQRLVDNPPIVTGETNDLFTILQNTAHFFRIIGKKNILVLKGILDREKATFEQTLADFYELTQQPPCLEKHFNLSVTPESVYLYSGFFLNTMGGRLYLFRRDSMSRMVVNFYAILAIENANRQGRNKYGIETKSAVNALIDEIESSKIDLKMRDYYLDTLYDLKEKYQ